MPGLDICKFEEFSIKTLGITSISFLKKLPVV